VVSGAARPDKDQIQCTFPYIQLIIKVLKKEMQIYYISKKIDWHLHPGSVAPTTASLLFLNPAVLVAVTMIL